MRPKYTQLRLGEKPIRVSRVECICTVCGMTFYVQPSRLKHGRGQTCSRECQYKSVSAKALARTYPTHISPRVEITCAVCGAMFDMTRAEFEWRSTHDKEPKYCSVQCAHNSPEWKANLSASLRSSEALKQSRPDAVKKMTETVRSAEHRQRLQQQVQRQMGDPEMRARWEEGVRKRTADPTWRAAKHFQRGPAHPRYNGGKTARQVDRGRYETKVWRIAVFGRDNYTCQACGVRGGYLHAHHVKPWVSYPDLRHDVSNGLTLCGPCHRKLHSAGRAGAITLETHDHTPDM